MYPIGYSSMLNEGHQQMVYYRSGEQLQEEGQGQVMSHENVTYTPHAEASDADANRVQYEESPQVATGGDREASQESESQDPDVVYQSTETNMAAVTQAEMPGNFTVLNPAAMMSVSSSGVESQTYVNQTASGATYHNISTLPFVQNGQYSGQTSYASATTIVHTSTVNGNVPFGEGTSSSYTTEEDRVKVEMDAEDDDEEEDDVGSGEDESEFQCPVCSDPFPDQQTLDDHVANHPPQKEFICETCNKSFATRRYLKYHRKNHCKRAGSYEGQEGENDPNGEIVKRFTCNVCSRPFRVLKCMKVHKKKKHGILKEFTCHTCAVTFETSQELVSHPCGKPPPPPSTPTPPIMNTIGVSAGVQNTTHTTHTTHTTGLSIQTPGPSLHSAGGPSPSVPPSGGSSATAGSSLQHTGGNILEQAAAHVQSPPLLPFTSPARKKKKLKQAKPACDICGKTFADRISVDIHRVKHIEEELYPCDMCENGTHENGEHHLAVYFRIKFFTDDNQHILEDQKAAAAGQSVDLNRSEESNMSTGGATPQHTPGTPYSAPATPVYLPPTPNPGTAAVSHGSGEGMEVENQQMMDYNHYTPQQIPQEGATSQQIVNSYVLSDGTTISHEQAIMLQQQQVIMIYVVKIFTECKFRCFTKSIKCR